MRTFLSKLTAFDKENLAADAPQIAHLFLGYQYSICIFNKILWIDATGLHSGEYRHGPFEVADADRSCIFLMDGGANHKIDQRALKFTRRITDKIILFDAGRYECVIFNRSTAERPAIWS